MADCFGYITQNDTDTAAGTADMGTKSERGYLLTFECGIQSMIKYEKFTTLYQKMDPTYDSCPMGEVMMLTGGQYAEVSTILFRLVSSNHLC